MTVHPIITVKGLIFQPGTMGGPRSTTPPILATMPDPVCVALAEIDDGLRTVSPWWTSISPAPDVSSRWAARQPTLLAFAMSSFTLVDVRAVRHPAVAVVREEMAGVGSWAYSWECLCSMPRRVIFTYRSMSPVRPSGRS